MKIQYSRNRYYDYHTGRFLTHDPLGITPNPPSLNFFDIISQYKDTLNLYEYVGTNPVVKLDPFGLIVGITCEWSREKCISAVHVYGHAAGDKEHPLYVKDFYEGIDIPNGELCCKTTIWLHSCYLGNNPRYLDQVAYEIAKLNICKRIRVCGCTGFWRYYSDTLRGWRDGYCNGTWVCVDAFNKGKK